LQSGLGIAVAERTINERQAHRVAYLIRPTTQGAAAGRVGYPSQHQKPSPLPEVAAYAGAALVASGIWMLTRDGWHDMQLMWKVLIAAVMTLLLGGAATTVGARLKGRMIEPAQERLAWVASTLAAMSASLTVGVCTPGYFGAALTLTGASALAYLIFRGFPALVTCWFGSVWAVAESPLFPTHHGHPWWAVALGAVALLWLSAGAVPLIAERELVVTLGGFTGLVAAEALALGEARFVCVGVAFTVAYVAALYAYYQRYVEIAAVPALCIAAVVPGTIFVRIFKHGIPGGIVLAVGGTLLVVLGAIAMRPKRAVGLENSQSSPASTSAAESDVLAQPARGAE